MKENGFKLNTFVEKLNERNLMKSEIENYFIKCSSPEISNSYLLQLKLCSTLIEAFALKEDFEFALSNGISFIKRIVKNSLQDVKRKKSLKKIVWSSLLLLWDKLKLLIEQDSCSADLTSFTQWLLKNVIGISPFARRFESSFSFNISENLYFVDDHFKDLSLDIVLSLKSIIEPQSRDNTLVYTVSRYILEEHFKPSKCVFKFLKLMMVAKVLHCVSKSGRVDATQLLQDFLKKMSIPSDFWKWAKENLNLAIPQKIHLKSSKQIRWILLNINVCTVYKILYGDKYLKRLSKKAEDGNSKINTDNLKESINNVQENEALSHKSLYDEDSKKSFKELANSELLLVKKTKKKRVRSLLRSSETADGGVWIVQQLPERKAGTLETEKFMEKLVQTNGRVYENCNNTTRRKEKRKINENNISKISSGESRKQLKRAHSFEDEEVRKTCSPSTEKRSKDWNIVYKPSCAQIHPKESTKRSVSASSVLRSVQASHEEVEKKRKRKQIKKSKLKVAQNSSVEVIGSSVVNTKNVMCSTKVAVDTKQKNKKINVKKLQTEKLKILQSSSSEAIDNFCRDTRTVGDKVEMDLKSTNNVKVEEKVKNRRRRLKALQNVDGMSISVECVKDVASTEEMAVIEPVSILKNKLQNGPSKGLILNKNNESEEEAVTETSRLSEVSVKKMKKTETYRHCEDLETKSKNKKIRNRFKRSKALQTNLDLCAEISFEDVNAATSKEELAEKKPKSILKNKLKTLPSKGLNLRKNSEDEIKAATETFRLKNKAVKKKKKNLLLTETYKNCEDLGTEEHKKRSVLSFHLEPREMLGKDHVCIKKRSKDKCLPHMENGKCTLKGSKNIEVEHDKSQEDSHTEFNDAWIIKQCDAKRTSIQEDISATLSDKVSRNIVTDEVGRSNVLNRNFEKETKDSSEVKIAEQIESTKRRKRKREQEKFITSLSSQSVLKNKKKKEGSELLEKSQRVKEKERTKKRRKTDHTKGNPSSIDNRNRYTICAAGTGGNEILGELNAKEKSDVSDLEVLEVKETKYDERLSKKSNKSFDVDEASGNESDIVDCDDHTMFTEEETSNYHQFQLKEMKEEKLRKAKSLLSKMKDPNEETLIVEEEPPVEKNNREELCKNTEDITQVLYKKMVHPVSDSAKSLDDSQEEEELPYGSDNDSDLEVIFDTINKDTIENRIKKEMHSNDEREGVSAAPAETAQSSEIFISSVFDLYRSAAKKSKEDVLYCGTIDRSRRDSIEVVEHKHFSVSDDSKNEIFLHCASENLIEENKKEVFDVSHDDLKKTETISASNASVVIMDEECTVVIMDEECSSTKENLPEANDSVNLNRDKESQSEIASISSIVDKNECELQSGCRNISEKENADMTLHSDKSAQEEKADNCELQSRIDDWETISVSSSKTEKGSEFLEIITLKSKDLDSENESERTEKCRKSKKSENNTPFFQSVREDEGKEALPESLLLDDRINFKGGSGDVRINSNGGSGDDEILSLSQPLTDLVYDERQKSIARSPYRKALCFDDEKEKLIGESTVLASNRRVSAEHICLLSGADVELESIATGAILLKNRTHENKENIMNNWQEEDLNGSSFSAGKESTVKVKEDEPIASIVIMSLRKDTRINSPRSPSKTASKQASLEKSASKMTTLTPLKVANAALENEIVISPHVSDESVSQISNTEIENAGIISFIPDDNILSKSCAEEEQEEEEEDKRFDFLSFTRNTSPSKMEQSLNQSNLSNSSAFSPLHLSKLSQNQSKLSDSTSRHSLSPSFQNLSTTPSPAKISSRTDTSGLTSGKKQSQFISPSKMQHHLASSEESPSLHINQSLKLSKNRSLSAERPTTHNSEDNSQLLCASNSKSSLILNNSSSFESPSYAKQSQKLTNSTRRRGSIESPQSSLIKKSSRLGNQSPSLSRNRSLPVKQLSTYTSKDDFQSPCSSNSRSSLILNSSLSDFQSPCTSNSRSSSLILNSSPSMESPYAKSSQKLTNTTRNKGSIESSQSPLIRRSPRLNDNCILKENSESPQSLLIRKSPRLEDNCTTKENIENLQSPLIRESPRLDDKCTTKESIESPQSPLIRKSPRLDANSITKESIEIPQSPLIRKSPRLDDKCITENVTSSGSSKLENDSSPLKESELPNSSEPSVDQTEERDKVDSSLKTRYTLRRRTTVTPVKQVVASPRRRRNSLSAIKDDEETAQMLSSPVRSRSRRNSLSGCETPLTPLRRSRRISGFPEVIAEEK